MNLNIFPISWYIGVAIRPHSERNLLMHHEASASLHATRTILCVHEEAKFDYGTKSTYHLLCDLLEKDCYIVVKTLYVKIIHAHKCSPFLIDNWVWHLNCHTHLTGHHISCGIPQHAISKWYSSSTRFSLLALSIFIFREKW